MLPGSVSHGEAMCDDEAKATDYLAKTVIQSRARIGPIGFVHHKSTDMIKTKPKQKPVAPPKKPGKGGKTKKR